MRTGGVRGYRRSMSNAEHEDLVRRWVKMFNTQDLADADALAVADYTEHAVAPFGRSETATVDGPTHLRETARWLLAQFPDLRMRIEAIVADGDLVAALVASNGTNDGRLNGILPPTGRSFAARQSHWFRVRDGRLAEHWATRDDLSAMIQLGVIAIPGPPR